MAATRDRSGIRIRAYIVSLGVATSGLLIGLNMTVPLPHTGELAIAILLALFTAAAYRFPIHFDVKSSVVLDTSVIYAAVLLFHPGQAMLIVFIGALAGQLLRRFEAEECVFNVSQASLQAGIAGLALLAAGWRFDSVRFDTPGMVVAITLVPVLIFLTNTSLVAAVIGLHTGRKPWRVWLQSTTRNETLEQAGQFTVGLLAAILVSAEPRALPLLVVTAIIMGVSLKRQFELRHRTIRAVERIANLVDLRDPYTASHSRRVGAIAGELATQLDLDPDEINLIERTGNVHDIGKIIIDLGLLSKPDKLTQEEWAIFERHPVTGVQMLEMFPDFAAGTALVRSHHERYDGKGYPDGLAGEEIPMGARILAVADSFDAMASPRPYRGALPAEVVLSELQKGRGSQWDANVVDALLELLALGRIVMGSPDERPYIVDSIGYRTEPDEQAA